MSTILAIKFVWHCIIEIAQLVVICNLICFFFHVLSEKSEYGEFRNEFHAMTAAFVDGVNSLEIEHYRFLLSIFQDFWIKLPVN